MLFEHLHKVVNDMGITKIVRSEICVKLPLDNIFELWVIVHIIRTKLLKFLGKF